MLFPLGGPGERTSFTTGVGVVPLGSVPVPVMIEGVDVTLVTVPASIFALLFVWLLFGEGSVRTLDVLGTGGGCGNCLTIGADCFAGGVLPSGARFGACCWTLPPAPTPGNGIGLPSLCTGVDPVTLPGAIPLTR